MPKYRTDYIVQLTGQKLRTLSNSTLENIYKSALGKAQSRLRRTLKSKNPETYYTQKLNNKERNAIVNNKSKNFNETRRLIGATTNPSKFSDSDEYRTELLYSIRKVQDFLKAQSSTGQGYLKARAHIRRELTDAIQKIDSDFNLTKENEKMFFDLYGELFNAGEIVLSTKYNVMRQINETIKENPNFDFDELLEVMRDKLYGIGQEKKSPNINYDSDKQIGRFALKKSGILED